MEWFATRGIGNNWVPCFVCGSGKQNYSDELVPEADLEMQEDGYYYKGGCQHDMAAFVDGRRGAVAVSAMFGGKVAIKYESKSRCQVKVGACANHLNNLRYLSKLTCCSYICKEKVELARNPDKELYPTVPEVRLDYLIKKLDAGEKLDMKRELESVKAGFKYL